jgi:hypothetical protein
VGCTKRVAVRLASEGGVDDDATAALERPCRARPQPYADLVLDDDVLGAQVAVAVAHAAGARARCQPA